MFHYKNKKRREVYRVYWYENDKHHSKAISPDLQATKEWMSRLADRLYAQKNNGSLMRNHLFNDFCKEYIDKYSKIIKQKRTQQKDISVVERFKKLCHEVVYTHQFTDNALNFYILARNKRQISKKVL
jgi:hypothetical protein